MDEDIWYEPTAQDLKPGTDIHDLVVEILEAWAPNYVDERVSSYLDWVDRVEGCELPDGRRISLGSSYEADSPFGRVKKIAKKIAADLR